MVSERNKFMRVWNIVSQMHIKLLGIFQSETLELICHNSSFKGQEVKRWHRISGTKTFGISAYTTYKKKNSVTFFSKCEQYGLITKPTDGHKIKKALKFKGDLTNTVIFLKIKA